MKNGNVPQRYVIDGVALDTDRNAAESGVTFCFTERVGGVSPAPYASLNLGAKGGDDPANVLENRRRVMASLGAQDLFEGLVIPNQVHGDIVALLRPRGRISPASIKPGADAVVCTVPDQAVMLLFADRLPVVIVGPGGFAVAHSGWRGTLAGIAGKTAAVLAGACGCAPSERAALPSDPTSPAPPTRSPRSCSTPSQPVWDGCPGHCALPRPCGLRPRLAGRGRRAVR